MALSPELDAFIAAMPKAELHVHLEGSVRPATLLALARRNGIALPFNDETEMREYYRFRDFEHFLAIYDLICDSIHTPDDLALMAYELGAAAAAERIWYLEVTFTTCGRLRRGLPLDDQLAGVKAGAQKAKDEFGVSMQFIPDIVAENTLDEAWTLARWAVQKHGDGVCALGLAGREVGRNNAALAPVFTYAKDAGLPRTLHAGETVGPESVWHALTTLHADRIGHGVRAIEDEKLVDLLYAMQTPLEICPTSNVSLGVAPDMLSHPIRRLWDAGCFLTVNTDDPPMFNTTLADEYRAIADTHSFSRGDIERLVLNAVAAAFLPPDQKDALQRRFAHKFALLTG